MKVGKGIQTALDVIREASEPLTVRQISAEVMRRLEIPVTADALKSVDSSLRFTLGKYEGQGIVAEGLVRSGIGPQRLRAALDLICPRWTDRSADHFRQLLEHVADVGDHVVIRWRCLGLLR